MIKPRAFQRKERVNIFDRLYWDNINHELVIAFCSDDHQNIWYGCEWNMHRGGDTMEGMQKQINKGSFQSKDYIKIYEIMSSFDSESLEEEASKFQSIMELYQSNVDENHKLAIEMFKAAALRCTESKDNK